MTFFVNVGGLTITDCYWFILFNHCCQSRLLDHELRMHIKAADATFDPKKLSFVLDACGVVQEAEIVKAQGRIQSAFRQSLQAGFTLFKTNLESDQVNHRRHLMAAAGDSAKQRAAIVGSLEASKFQNMFLELSEMSCK